MFDLGSVRVRFVVDRVVLRGFCQRTSVFPLSIIPPLFHTHLQLHVAVTRTKRRSLGNCTKQCSFVYRRALDRKILPLVLFRNIIFYY